MLRHVLLGLFFQVLFLFIHQQNAISASVTPELVVIDDQLEEVCLAREPIVYLEDPSNGLTFSQVKDMRVSGIGFLHSHFKDLINFNTRSSYWLYFKIENQSEGKRDYRIEMYDFDIDHIDFYEVNGDRVQHARAGYALPFLSREIPHKNVSFDLNIPIGQSREYYMRFKSSKKNVLEPMLRSYGRVLKYGLNEYIILGVFYGLMLLMIFYNFLYFIILRKLYYLYYVFFACGTLLYFLSLNGTGFQFLWPSFPGLNPYMSQLGLYISSVSMILFTKRFLTLGEILPKIASNIWGVVLARTLIAFLGITGIVQFSTLWVDLFIVQVVFGISIIVLLNGHAGAKWFVVAFSFLNLSFLISVLEQFYVIPSSIFTVYVLNAGVVFQFVFLSISIAESVKGVFKRKNEIQKELIDQYKVNEALAQKVNRELEEKVGERTQELEDAKEELKAMNDRINNMNLSLDTKNRALEKSITTIVKDTTQRGHLSFKEFAQAYPDDLTCKKLLFRLKEEKGFVCKKCGNKTTMKGKHKYDARCSSCEYNESITANTIFHRSRLDLNKSLYLLYLLYNNGDEHTSRQELCIELGIHLNTFGTIENKIRSAISANGPQRSESWESCVFLPT